MDEVCGQSRLFAASGSDVRLPVAHMVCNQTPPVGDKPSLMTFREVSRGMSHGVTKGVW
jgi:oligopeptidase A